MVALAEGHQGELDNDLQTVTNTSLTGQQDGPPPGALPGTGGIAPPSNLTSSSTMDTVLHVNVTADVTTGVTTTNDHPIVTSQEDGVTSSLPPGGGVVASTVHLDSPSTPGKETTVSARATAIHPNTALPATSVRSTPSAPPPPTPSHLPHIDDKLLPDKSSLPTHPTGNNNITESTPTGAPTIFLHPKNHQDNAHQQNETISNQDAHEIQAGSGEDGAPSGDNTSMTDTEAEYLGEPSASPGHQSGDHPYATTPPPSSLSHLITSPLTHLPSAPPPVGGSKSDVHSTDILTKITDKSLRPFNKTAVVTLARSGEGDPIGGGALPVAAVVVPVICVLFLLVIALAVLLYRRRAHTRDYKHHSHTDEESSTDVTSSLMSPDPNGNDSLPSSEPVYAIVDKSKKRRATDSLSGVDESVSLTTIGNPVYTAANGSCMCQGADSTQGGAVGPTMCTEDNSMVAVDGQPLYDVPPLEEDQEDNHSGPGCDGETTPQVRGHGEGAGPPGTQREGLVAERGGAQGDLTLVECDVYEAADHYDPSRDDENGTYEIPDSPATVRARRSVARISGLLQEQGYLPADTSPSTSPPTSPSPIHPLSTTFGDESLAIPQRADDGNTSDSSSGLDSDFEDLWPTSGTGPRPCNVSNVPAEATNKTEDEDDVVRTPPPVPRLPPESEADSDYYLSPTCHTHYPPGPDWKPFHEYDPVYVPHSDPSAMAARVDNQNYVRGRQRSDSRSNPYEEIQFGAIYDTVDDDDDVFQPGQHPRNPIQVPPRVPIPPSPPPPLVPRRVRPISGVADVGGRPRSMNKPIPEKPLPDTPLAAPEEDVLPGVVLLQQPQEPRYSGLIMEDVPRPQEEVPQHDYTPLEYTKLHSVGSGALLDDDDIKAMDETDSETYSKEAFIKLQQQHPGGQVSHQEQEDQQEQEKPPLPPRLMPTKHSTNQNDTTVNGSADYKADMLFRNGNVVNGNRSEPYSESSSDSDDSYEPFDFSPPEPPVSK